ncbi:hypothetical protein ALC56_12690, partial [Trachymyrmex septentrionalis]
VLYFGILFFTVLFFIPDVLDIVAPLNKPRQHQLPLVIEPIFDLEEHFLLFILNFLIIALIILTILLTVETLYMICIQHACGLLKLTSYRILNAFDDRLQLMNISKKSKCTICIKLSKAIKIHKRSLDNYFLINEINIFYFILLEAVTTHNLFEAILTGLFVYAHFCYGFFMNYFGQDIIDHSENLFRQIYSTRWYTAPLYAQKLLLITLQQSMKNSKIIVGGLFIMSLEGLATVMSMSHIFARARTSPPPPTHTI